jgi:hypothetical protein
VQAGVVSEINASPLPTKKNLVFRKRAVARKIRSAAPEKDGSPERSLVVPSPLAKKLPFRLMSGFSSNNYGQPLSIFPLNKFPARFHNGKCIGQ